MLSFGARYLSSLTHVPSGTSRSIPSTGGDLAVPLGGDLMPDTGLLYARAAANFNDGGTTAWGDDAAAPDRVEAPVEWSRRASGITL